MTSSTVPDPVADPSFADALRAPLTPDAPAGESLRYDDDYRRLRDAVESAGSVGGAIDHEQVLRRQAGEAGAVGSGPAPEYEEIEALARTLLLERSRDLQVAAYFGYGALRTRGAAGLLDTLDAVSALVDAHWDTLHPRKPVRRANALRYLIGQALEWAEGRPFEPDHVGLLAAVSERIGRLQAETAERLGERAPPWSRLQAVVAEAHRKADRDAARLEPDPEPEPG